MSEVRQLELQDEILQRGAPEPPPCPRCGGVLRLRDGGANIRGTCPSCSITVLIPKRP